MPHFSFEIPEDQLNSFISCKFGLEFGKTETSTLNNVDCLLIGNPLIVPTKRSDTFIIGVDPELTTCEIEWNPSLYKSDKFNKTEDKYKMYLCFVFDGKDGRHVFGDLIHCRFVLEPEYSVKNWIHQDDIDEFLKNY